MEPLKIVFDTNVFRDIQRGKISEAEVIEAEAKLCQQGEGYIAALTLFELGSHIDDQERQYYDTFRDAFRASTRLCKRALPDPESFMCRHAFGLEPAWESICEEEIFLIANLIASSDSYDDLAIPREAILNGKPVSAKFNRGFLRAFRASTEGDYVNDMYDVVAKSVISDYDERRALSTGPVRLEEGPERSKFLEFLKGSEMRDALVRSQATRLNIDWSAIPVSSEQVWERLHAFFSAYITILRDFLRWL